MLNDFTKLSTFLTVVKEKSFSKASAKLGISQPAVTQQIRFIEDYLNVKIIDRKKNGVRLTKEGEQLLNIAQKIERCVSSAEREILKIMDKDITFSLGTSFVIGNYVLPTFLNNIKEKINNDTSVTVDDSAHTIEKLLDKQIDMALIESPVMEEGAIYREWLEDEIVIFSNQKLPRRAKDEDLLSYKWVCRDKNSHTRKVFKEHLEQAGMVDCDNFNIVSEASSPTTIIQTVMHSSTEDSPTCSIVSRHAISDLVAAGKLHEARLPNIKMKRKLYIAYLKDRKHDAFIENVVSYLMTIKK
jgi:DNA-binding transcriptional LysR family regulator